MKPIQFPEQNGTLGGGPGANFGTTEQVLDLPVHRNGAEVISCWSLSLWERIKLLFRGRLWLLALAPRTHVPIALTVDKPFEP
jgi:hypothetical protein